MSVKKKILNTSLLSVILASLVTMGLSAQQPTRRPTLIVGIVVDGLSLDQINLLRGHFGPDGFNRLLSRGITITDLDFGSALDPAAASAVIYTGAAPSINGIDAKTKYDRTTRRPVSTFHDGKTMGNFTTETLSPNAMRVSTIGDELRISTGGLGHVYTIAPQSGQALAMSGHAANSAFWINDINGKWSTSTFYKEVPTPIMSSNHRNPIEFKLDTITWSPLRNASTYPDIPSYKKLSPFRHSFARNDIDRYRRFMASPMVNREVTAMAIDYIKSMNLGKSENFDMINLAYTLSPYTYGREVDSRMELMDSYIRLDRELATLFKAIDHNGPGMNNTLLFLAGTPASTTTRREEQRWSIQSGEFSPRRAISLLNVYLTALHGNGDWVTGFHDNKFYLNHDLIKKRGLELKKVRSSATELLSQMEGIAEAFSIEDIINGRAAETIAVPRRNVNISTAGDIYVSVIPGWQVIDDGTTIPHPTTYPMAQRFVAPIAPAFILAPNIGASTISTPVDARALAPTISSILRIRAPNAALLPPLRLNTRL
ncbi:MAG: hypothetical protein HDS83_00590 [Bacteroidales bacterium]|nr:hypothetical protein [Bacteroidales bacterium]